MPYNLTYDEDYISSYASHIHFCFLIDLFATILALYLILKHSAPSMKIYKYILANISIISILMDTFNTVIYVPFLLLPTPAVCAEGLTKHLGLLWGNTIPYFIWNEVIGWVGCSLDIAFAYRYYAVRDELDSFSPRKTFVRIALIHIFAAFPAIVILYLSIFVFEDGIYSTFDYYEKEWPGIFKLFHTRNCNGINVDLLWTKVYLIVIILSFMAVFLIGSYFVICTIYELYKIKSQISAQTYKLQKQMLIAVIFQGIIPSLALFYPYMLLMSIALFKIDFSIQELTGLLLQFSTLHSFLNTLIMCIFINCYRKPFELILKRMWNVFKRNDNQTVVLATKVAVVQSEFMRPTANLRIFHKSFISDISPQESPSKTDRELNIRSLPSFGARVKQVEVIHREYIFFMQGPFKNVPHPWNGLLFVFYQFAIYFSIFSYSIPFIYRYFLVVKETAMSNTKFYFLYAVTGLVALIITFGVNKSTQWPGWDPINGSEIEQYFDGFWRDDNSNVPVFILTRLSDSWAYTVIFSAFGLVSLTYSLAGFFCIKTIQHFKRLQDLMLERDKNLQRQITFVLVGQATVPGLFGGVPLMLIFLDGILDLNIPRVGIIGMSLLSWTTFINPFCAIWFIKPYRMAVRDFLLNIFCRHKIVHINPDVQFGGTTVAPSPGVHC